MTAVYTGLLLLSPCLLAYLSPNTMMFSLALLSGITLFSSAAGAVTHQIAVGNDSGGHLFQPSYIVRQPVIHYIFTVALTVSLSDCRDGRHCRVYFHSEELLCDSVQLYRTMHAQSWRIGHRIVRPVYPKNFMICLFDAFPHPLHSVSVANGTSNGNLPTWQFTVTDVCDPLQLQISYHMDGLSDCFFSDGPYLDTLSPGCKHCGESLRPGHGVCSKS